MLFSVTIKLQAFLQTCDALYMLQCWQQQRSEGYAAEAQTEVQLTKKMQLSLFSVSFLEDVDHIVVGSISDAADEVEKSRM
jgi:hypothetical protein